MAAAARCGARGEEEGRQNRTASRDVVTEKGTKLLQHFFPSIFLRKMRKKLIFFHITFLLLVFDNNIKKQKKNPAQQKECTVHAKFH